MEAEPQPPNLLSQAKAIGATGLSALENRGELFVVEWEEERTRLLEMLIWVLAAGFLGMMFLALFTLLIVWMFPKDMQIFALGGFCVLYLAGAIFAFLNLKSLLANSPPPFESSLNEMKKDREWLESLK